MLAEAETLFCAPEYVDTVKELPEFLRPRAKCLHSETVCLDSGLVVAVFFPVGQCLCSITKHEQAEFFSCRIQNPDTVRTGRVEAALGGAARGSGAG